MNNQRKGFTLIEMLVAMAVMAIVLGEIGMVLSNSMKVYNKSTVEVRLQSEASQAVQWIENLMCDATASIDTTASLTPGSDKIIISDWINKEAGTKSSYTIELKMDKPGKDYGTLWITTPTGSTYPMAEYVKKINVAKDLYDVNSVVELKLEMKNDQYAYNVSKDIYNRNEIGTGGSSIDDISAGSGTESLNVLRFHTYDLRDILPYDKTWVSAAFETTEPAAYYNLSGFTLEANATLNSNDSYVGQYDIKCKADDDSEYIISIYSEKPMVAGGDNNLLYCYTVTSDPYTSYVPIKGLSVEDCTECRIDWNVGQTNLQSETLSVGGTFHIDNKNWSGIEYYQQIDNCTDPDHGPNLQSLTFRADALSNSCKFIVGRFMNEDKYGAFIYQYEVLIYGNVTLKWANGRTLSFRLFCYPIKDNGTVFSETQKEKFWDLVDGTPSGGQNDDLTVQNAEDGGGGGGGEGGGEGGGGGGEGDGSDSLSVASCSFIDDYNGGGRCLIKTNYSGPNGNASMNMTVTVDFGHNVLSASGGTINGTQVTFTKTINTGFYNSSVESQFSVTLDGPTGNFSPSVISISY